MDTSEKGNNPKLTFEERRLRLEERRLALDSSFARKWLPTLATVIVGLIAGMFSIVQQQASIEETTRARIEAATTEALARIEAKAQGEREWGVKVVEMYFREHELFDMTQNPEAAERNLSVLAAVAPTAVKGVLDAERVRILPPSDVEDAGRINSLAAVARVQDALALAEPFEGTPEARLKPADFTVYVQYGAADKDKDLGLEAQRALVHLGYRVPGIERVTKVPSRLQVRYYRPEQKAHAGELAVELGKRLGLSATQDNAILVTSSKQLPGGILEVWLPPRES